MTKTDHQKLAIKFKKENNLSMAIPGKIVKTMPKTLLPYVKHVDDFLSNMCDKRENRNNAIVKRCYDVLRGFAEQKSEQEALKYLYVKANAQDYLLQEYNTLKADNTKIVTFTLNIHDSYMPKGLPSLKYKIKWIKKAYKKYHQILSQVMFFPTYTLETQVESDGTYQVHAHGFCSESDYSVLKSFASVYGYVVAKRELKGKAENFVAYITKDQVVTKRHRINSYKKVEDPNSVAISIATYKDKFSHIPFVNGKRSKQFKPLIKEVIKGIMKFFRKVLKVSILKNINIEALRLFRKKYPLTT